MTNKPFEVQDSTIVLNGVPLEITEGGTINVNNNPVAGGDRLTNGENEFVLTEQGTVELNGEPFTGGGIQIRNSADGNTNNYWDLASYGMATLIKVGYGYWYISGNVTQD